MQAGICRFLLFCLRPALFGLLLAALAPAGSVVADEVMAAAPVVPWQGLLADDNEPAFRQHPVSWQGLARLEFIVEETGDGSTRRSLFFRAADWVRFGARGSFDLRSRDLRAIVALRLDF